MKSFIIGAFAVLFALVPSVPAAKASDAEMKLFESLGEVLYYMEINERIRQQCNYSLLTMHDILRIDEIIRNKTSYSYFEALDMVSEEGVDEAFFNEEALELVDVLGCTPALFDLWDKLYEESFRPALRYIWSFNG
ncbi:hypothetical protein [Aliidiomarina indica]|uniref:hypothetical protein n=1 Tax=Aliidiomarina indica TaxID=2749147 RepID=UPI001890A033|nr:hypothetical protein [Aliidiomarina indica]